MLVTELALLFAYFGLFFLVPGGLLLSALNQRGHRLGRSWGMWLLVGLAWHLPTLAVYRLLATKLGLSVAPYFIFHLVLFVLVALRVIEGKKPLLERLKPFFDEVFSFRGASLLAGALFVLGIFLMYQVRPIHEFYQDEHQRMSIAHFIKLAYPPPEFHVYSPSETYRYYNFAELLTATISQFTGLSVEWTYFRVILPFNWLMIFFAFFALCRTGKNSNPSYPLITLLFVVFFLAQGLESPQKVTHFTFHQNTFALLLLLFSSLGLFKFFETKDPAPFFLAMITSSMIVGTKLVAFTPLAVAIPLSGIIGWSTRRMRFRTLVAAGALSAFLVAFWYLSIVYNPAAEAQAKLEFSGSSWPYHQLKTKILQHPPGYYFDFLRWLIARGGQTWGTYWAYHAEWVLLVLAAFVLNFRRVFCAFGWGFWALFAGVGTAFYIFKFYNFSISSSSLVYFLFFASWLLAALLARVVAQSQKAGALPLLHVIVILVLINASVHYAWEGLVHFKGPNNNYQYTQNELEGFKILQENTLPTDWVLHNYYEYPSHWSFASLSARRSILTTFYPGAINQNPKLYKAIKEEVEDFYNGMIDKQKDQFFSKYPARAVWIHTGKHSPQDLTAQGFVKMLDKAPVQLWVHSPQK